jgi:hypothetical protein
LLILILFVFFIALFFAYWYLVKCDVSWEGVPLEARGVIDLRALQDRLKDNVLFLQNFGPRNSANETNYAQLNASAQWLTKQWESQGYKVIRHEFQVLNKSYANLEIEIPGVRAPSEIVIISAQYDTLPDSPGANNDASGVATLLRLSELLKNQKLDRTLRLVLFVNEEDPFFGTDQMGSYIYAKESYKHGEDIRAMLSLDAIGIYKHEAGSQKLPWPYSLFYPDRGDFLAFIANIPSRECVKIATLGFRKGSSFPISAGLAPEWVDGVTWSDHSSFWKFGYCAVQVTDTGAFRSITHTTKEDTIDKIDFDALARITLGMYGTVLELTSIQNSLSKYVLPSRLLFFNGTIILLIGLLLGFPFWLSIIQKKSASICRAWRVAHTTLIFQGILMLVAALALPHIVLNLTLSWLMVFSLIVAGYGFAFALALGAWIKKRGLLPGPFGLNTLLFIGHAIGVIGSLVGVSLILYSAFMAI